MTRDEYMTALKNNIQSLTLDEQNEALQYYSDYFDDAGDDEKVMEELGSPEEVAKIIRERFSNTLVGKDKAAGDSDSQENSSDSSAFSDALYYEFKKSDIKNVEFGFGAAEVVIISGSKFSVESRGITKQNLLCRIDGEKTLVVKNLNKLSGFNFLSHDHSSRIVPRILITIPSGTELGKFKAGIGAGNFQAKNVDFSFESGNIDVGAGNFILNTINGKNLNMRCGMGNLHIQGTLTGRSNIDCGMGAIKLELKGNQDDYSCDAKVGLGDFRFNKDKRSGVCKVYTDSPKANHFSVNCGMGSVIINMD
ncbi:MAG: DUF4097 family beta strand repeat protein [Treponema sp.]|nr:DUF4097 family beta strand repeat protein [Treponema sp.]